jgi:hypothetical protein
VAACAVVIKAKSAAENLAKSAALNSVISPPSLNVLAAVNFFAIVAIF